MPFFWKDFATALVLTSAIYFTADLLSKATDYTIPFWLLGLAVFIQLRLNARKS
jgi:hypothetical protein